MFLRPFRFSFNTYTFRQHSYACTRTMASISLQHASLGPVTVPSELNVQLTDTEEKVCVLLDACRDHLERDKGISTTCRIAGGWVRDKLLGSQSNDIDVALSNIMGLAFAQHLAEFASQQGVEVGTISKIAQNPDQSKHLETATFKVYGLDLDLVNLRSEEYAANSRIPTEVSFGTPDQDALRRDITINALFYNVHTRMVEDHTKSGLDDLRNGVIRTPLPPQETFLDDPLRILRCVRFASRFGFKLMPELEHAAKEPNIQEALVSKVARERVGIEVSKMMKGRDPLQAIRFINSLSLYSSIFSVIPPEVTRTFSRQPGPEIESLKAASILQALLSPPPSRSLPPIHPILFTAVNEDPTCKDRLFLAAALTPYRGVNYKDKKNKDLSAVAYVIRESLKLGAQNHYLDGIPSLFAASELLKNPDVTHERFKQTSERAAIGNLLREKAVHNANTGSHWTSSVLFSLVQELVSICDTIEDGLAASEATEIVIKYNTFVGRVEELDLPKVIDARPLLDGREVVSLLDAKPGPWTGQVLARVMTWQLDNPTGSKEDCTAWLKEQHSAGKLSNGEVLGQEPANKKARIH